MGVLAIWRYPVKAMLGELLESVEVGTGGLEGDRRWVVVDDGTGERIANKRGPTDPALRECRARIGVGGVLEVTLPDGAVACGLDQIEAALSELLGRPVRLAEHDGGAGGRRAHGFAATAGHHDIAPVHLLTTRTLAHLRAEVPESDWDERRFRPNLVLDDGDRGGGRGGFSEDALLGGSLISEGGGGVRLDVGLPTPRCVVPTRAREELPRDTGMLRAIARRHRFDLGPFGHQPCVGAYAEVAAGGRLRVGDRLSVRRGAAPSPEAAATERVQRLIDE